MNLKSIWIGLLLLGTLGAQAEDSLLAHVPKDITAAFRLDWKAMQSTELLQTYMAEHPERYQKTTGRLMDQAGIDLKTVDNLWIFTDANSDGVICLQGTFDLEAVEAALAEKASVTVEEKAGTKLAFSFTDQEKGEPRLGAFLDAATMIAGKPSMVENFLAGRAGGVPTHGADNAKLQRVATDSGILAATVFTIPQSWQSNQEIPLVQMVMPMVDDLFLSASLNESFSLDLFMTPKKADFKEPLQNVLKSILQILVASQQPTLAQDPENPSAKMVVGLLEKVTVTPLERDVKLSINLSTEDFESVKERTGMGSNKTP